jgi:hypothetical protein
VASILDLLEDARAVMKNGASPGIRILTMWGKESLIREVAFLRNRSLHLLSTVEFQIHANLTLRIRITLVGGDNKSLQADQFLLADQRCASCTAPSRQWGLNINVD